MTSGTATFSGAMALGSTDDFVVSSGATVTHAAEDSVGLNITARNVTVTGNMNTDAKGCAGGASNTDGSGPNTGTGVCTLSTGGYGVADFSYGGGGSYGGRGGSSSGGVQGTTYGSNAAPTFLGSGGGGTGYAGGVPGGTGGGKIRLDVTGTFTNSGTISAVGSVGSSGSGGTGAGGGSGGSVYITAGTLAGGGTISAAGGAGGSGSYGHGAGGRVAVYYTTNASFTLANITAERGGSGAGAENGSTFVLDRYTDDGSGTLTITSGLDFVSGGDYTRTNITVSSGAMLSCGSFATLNIGATSTLTFSGVTMTCSTVDAVNIVANTWTTSGTNVMTVNKVGAVVDWDIANTLTLNNFTYNGALPGTSSANGGVLSMDNAINVVMVNSSLNTNLNFTGLASMNLDGTSTMSGNAKGCAGGASNTDGSGPNTGTGVCTLSTGGYGVADFSYGGGGSYGGRGGSSSGGVQGTTYGSNAAPTFLGSGGGGTGYAGGVPGGTGGGKIRLDVTGTFTNSGTISVTGSTGSAGPGGTGAGGGSGGSVYITAGTLAGGGTISAAGGASGCASCGHGAGGRVAVYYTTNSSFTLGNITASKGGSGAATEDGTVYILQYTVPSTPSIIAPLSGGLNVSVNPTLTGSAFSSSGASHTSSTWKITTDSGGNTIVWSKDADTSNLTSIVVNTTNGTFAGVLNGASTLANSTTYYAFVRYTNVPGNSNWSLANAFTTTNPNNTSTLNLNFTDASSYTAGASVEVIGGVGRTIDSGGGVYPVMSPVSLAAWTKRKALTITNNVATTFTNLQAKFTVTYDADMQADFDDLRFTNVSGTALDYWIESKTDSTTATVWVEVDSISASSTATVYMYYGNGAASAGSNGTNTFITFDDFNDNSLDESLWTTKNTDANRTVSEASSALTVAANTSANSDWWSGTDSAPQIYTAVPGSGDWSAEVTVTAYTDNGSTHGGIAAIEHWSDGGKTYTFGRYNGGTTGRSAIENLGSTIDSTISTPSLPTRYRVRLNGTTKYYDYSNDSGVNWTSVHNTTNNTIGYVALFQKEWSSNAASITFDNFFIRNNASTEPSVSTGAELTLTAESAVTIVNTAAITATYTDLGTFTETVGAGNLGTMYYQMSKDGTNWKYWNGSNWISASTGNYNTASTVNAYLPQFVTDIGKGKIYVKTFLIGNGAYAANDNVAIAYAPLTVALSTATQTIAENGGSVTVTAQLSSTFSSDVVIPYTVTGTAIGGGVDHNLANGNITVTAGSTTGTATFSVINDDIDETNETVIVTLGTPNYGDLSGTTVQTITITDNDTAGITVVESASSTAVREGDYTDTYTIVLATQPTASVVVAIASTMSEATPSPTPVTFTTVNWATPQTITVTAIDDSDVESSQSDTFTHTVTSVDSYYNGFSVASVSVAITDNDHRSSSSTTNTVLSAEKTITVVSPVLGTQVLGGGTINVSWNDTGVIPFVTVSLSTDEGSTWTVMKSNISNVGSTSFAAPSTTTTTAVVKVEGTDLVTSLATGISVPFTIAVASTTAIVSPTDTASGEDSSSLPSGISIHNLIKLANDGNSETQMDSAVYYVGTDLNRHAFPNASVYFSWYANFDTIIIVSAADLAALDLGLNVTYKPGVKMVKFESSPKVYAVDQLGVLRWVTSENAAIELYGTTWNTNIDVISDAFFGNYSFGTDVGGIGDFDPDGFSDIQNPSLSMSI